MKPEAVDFIKKLELYGIDDPSLLRVKSTTLKFVRKLFLDNMENIIFITSPFCSDYKIIANKKTLQVYNRVIGKIITKNFIQAVIIMAVLRDSIFNKILPKEKRFLNHLGYVAGMINWIKEGAFEDKLVLDTIKASRAIIYNEALSIKLRRFYKNTLEDLLNGLKVDFKLTGKKDKPVFTTILKNHNKEMNKLKYLSKKINEFRNDALKKIELKRHYPNLNEEEFEGLFFALSPYYDTGLRSSPALAAKRLLAKKYSLKPTTIKDYLHKARYLSKLVFKS